MLGMKYLKSATPYVTLAVLTIMLLAPVMSRAVDSSDYKRHYDLALDFIELDHINHPLFHEAIRFYRRLVPYASREHVLLVTALTFKALLPLPIYWWFGRTRGCDLPDYVLMLLVLGLLIVSPITLWTDQRYMLGYFNPVIYHSPTLNALRLFLVPLVILSLAIFDCHTGRAKSRRVIDTAVSALLVVLATLAKPSFTIALVPGLSLFGLWRCWQHRSVDRVQLVIGFCLPGCVVLGVLYQSTFVAIDDGSSIAIGLLTALSQHVPLWRIPLQILLSVAFPVVVYLLFLAEARRHLLLNLSWSVFIVGALMSLLLYESGPRLQAGNFLWTSYSAIFVLMFASLSFLIERYAIEQESAKAENELAQPRLSLRFNFALLFFGLHVLSGIAYYFRTISEF